MNAREFLELQEAYQGVYQELDELWKGKHGQSEKEYQAGRSDAGKRISGDENTGPRYYTLGRARGAKPDAPTAPGARPVNTPKLSRDEKEYHQYNKSDAKRRSQYNKVGGSKGLPEEVDTFDAILEHLVAEGYADTNDNALAIMANMSEDWRDGILQQLDELSDRIVRATRNKLKQNTQRKRASDPDRQKHANREFQFNKKIINRNQRTGSNVSPTDVEFRNR